MWLELRAWRRNHGLRGKGVNVGVKNLGEADCLGLCWPFQGRQSFFKEQEATGIESEGISVFSLTIIML